MARGRQGPEIPASRPAPTRRMFESAAVEDAVADISGRMRDGDLATLFANTLPNTLDTTVFVHDRGGDGGHDDSFIITGDINAMWLRDSTNQVNPYHELASGDSSLQSLLRGLIHRQISCVLLDEYANAFNVNVNATPYETTDVSTKPSFLGTRVNALSSAVWERKYELDSLCATIRLAARYFETTADPTPFGTAEFEEAMQLIVDTMVEQQKGSEEDPDQSAVYQFQRPVSCCISHNASFTASHSAADYCCGLHRPRNPLIPSHTLLGRQSVGRG